DRLLEKDVLAGLEAFLGHGVMSGLRSSRNHDRVDGRIFQKAVIVRRCSDRLGFRRHLFQALLSDFSDVQFTHVGARGAGFRTYTAAPARSDNSNADFFHEASAGRIKRSLELALS